MSPFFWWSALGSALVVGCALRFRSRSYAIFRGVTLTLQVLISSALLPHVGAFQPAFYVLQGLVLLQSLMLVWPRLRPRWVVLLVSVPGLFFAAATLLALPWSLVAAFGGVPHGWWVPFVLALIGVWQSLRTRAEQTQLVLKHGGHVDGMRRHPSGSSAVPLCSGPPLRIVQITDPHLGPFMSVQRLKGICERAVQSEPDLIVLTGDYLTMESQADWQWLAEALEPLRRARGKVFACLGNHDHEALATVRRALEHAHVTLLVDEAALLQTQVGPVQVLGFDFHWQQRAERTRAVCAAYPRQPGATRLLLLHDPGAFKHLPEGDADLVLSGHTHGGQVGLVSLRLSFTLANAIAKIPDHGLWARGLDRLYVHRGTGHYGFPLRLGVPAEESMLLVYTD